MLAQIIIGLIILVVISAAAFGLYASLHSSASSNNAQQYVLNLRGSVDQMFSSNPNFTGFNTQQAVNAGIFSPAVGNTLASSKVTAPAGFTVKLGNVSGKNNEWTMQLGNVGQGQCGTLAGSFTDSNTVSIAVNGPTTSNPAYSSGGGGGGGGGGGSSTWPPSTATLIGSCQAGSNTITWTFAN